MLAAIETSAHQEVARQLARDGLWTQLCSNYVPAAVLRHTDLIEEYLEVAGYQGDVVVHLTADIPNYGAVDALVDMSRFGSVEEIEFALAEHLIVAHPRPVVE